MTLAAFALFAALASGPSGLVAKITGYVADCSGCTGRYYYGGAKAHWSDRSLAVTDAAAEGRDKQLPAMAPGSKWCVTFTDDGVTDYTLTYTVRDRCPPLHWVYPKKGKAYQAGCGAGHVDVLTRSSSRAFELTGQRVNLARAK